MASTVKARFQGAEGERLLYEALLKQDILSQVPELAAALAKTGELVEFQPNSEIIVQEGTDNDVFFILSGETNVFVNDRFIGSRSETTCIGEMAAIDAAAPRSATVKAKTPVVALKLTETQFREALDAHPIAYRSIAQLIAYRLRQRAMFHQPPNPQPVIFLGCSTESLNIAQEIQAGLKHDPMEVVIWTNGVFGPSGIAVDVLSQFANSADFALFLVSADDRVISRAKEVDAPRDNVIFELGLFMGRLDRNRVFIVTEAGLDVKIPSDLLGVTPITYVLKKSSNLAAAIGPVCTELRKIVGELGVR